MKVAPLDKNGGKTWRCAHSPLVWTSIFCQLEMVFKQLLAVTSIYVIKTKEGEPNEGSQLVSMENALELSHNV